MAHFWKNARETCIDKQIHYNPISGFEENNKSWSEWLAGKWFKWFGVWVLNNDAIVESLKEIENCPLKFKMLQIHMRL